MIAPMLLMDCGFSTKDEKGETGTKNPPEDGDKSKDSPDGSSNYETSLEITLDNEPKFGT